MTQVSDLIQSLLSLNDIVGVVACVLIFTVALHLLTLMMVVKSAIIKGAKWYIYRFVGKSMKSAGMYLAFCFLGGYFIYLFRGPISDILQSMEPPVYDGQYNEMASTEVQAIFENEIRKINPPAVASTTITRTRALADSLHIPPEWIYSTALSECALNPHTVRRDKIAAGWIQFTGIGLSGITSERMPDVIRYCQEQNTAAIMDLTDKYMHFHCRGKTLSRPVDVYLAVFSPDNIGSPPDNVLYSGYRNPSYYLNAGIDGWVKDQSGRITRRSEDIDGKITTGELALMLEARKNRLISYR